MKILLTSDWQADANNLDLCEIAQKELLAAIEKHHVDVVINAGDLKEQYSPVHVPVIKFWVRATRQIKEAGAKHTVLLGNHDRISQSADSKNWMDIIRAAGASTVTKPQGGGRWTDQSCISLEDGTALKATRSCSIAFLPYTADKKLEVAWARSLADGMKKKSKDLLKLLVFHTEVAGAQLNSFGAKAVGNTPEDLCFDAYDLCFGGHVHMHQQITSNSWYIGSPFCQDWGEANQTKGFLLLDSDSGTFQQLKTSIPGWYDAEYLEERCKNCTVCLGETKIPAETGGGEYTYIPCPKCSPEAGAYIRSKVPVTTKKISFQIRQEETRLAQVYENARLFVVPVITQAQKLDVNLSGDTDQERVEQYIASRVLDGVRFNPKQAIGYLVSKLKTIAPGASGKRLRFLKLTAKETLCFRELAFKYHKQGLVLLRGVNRDWPGRSNGAGKTSLLSMLPIALFGESVKGQKNDGWARDDSIDPSVVTLTLRDERKRLIEIIRSRPHSLILKINGEDVSSGLTGKRKQETQGQIEEASGFDLQMLLNSVYVDQTIANGFVFGTQKDRMDLVGKLCSLERYDEALKLVAVDIKKNQQEINNSTAQVESLVEEQDRLDQELTELQEELQQSKPWAKQAGELRKKLKALAKEQDMLLSAGEHYTALQRELDELIADTKTAIAKLRQADVEVLQYRGEAKKAVLLIQSGNCPECGQPSKEIGQRLGNRVITLAEDAKQKKAKWESVQTKLEEKEQTLTTKIRKYTASVADLEQTISINQTLLKQAEEGEKQEAQRNKKHEEEIQSKTKQLQKTKRILEGAREHLKSMDIDREMLEYAQKAFHRSGMPLYISASLCPLLNKAAQEYSELFSQGKLTITFSVIDNEFIIDIANPHGSDKTEGQSVGEAATAGIITAFALREVSPRTNLLILDEPGHGLDEQGAKQFAKGIIQMSKSGRFGTILLCTHSQVIESALAGEAKVWTVTKHKGISTLTQ